MIILIQPQRDIQDGSIKYNPLLIETFNCNCRDTNPINFAKEHGVVGASVSVLEMPIDQWAADILGASALCFLGKCTGEGPSLAIGHSRMYGNVIVCRKHNGVYQQFKATEYYRAIINYYLSIFYISQGPEQVATDFISTVEGDALFKSMMNMVFKNGME